MRSSLKCPVTAEFNEALRKKAANLVQKAADELARAMNQAVGIGLQAECDHEWFDWWEDQGDHHRSDMTQVWTCKKCKARYG